MFQIIAAALTIAAVLTGYTVHTVLSYKPRHAGRDHNLPSQAFLRTFAEPLAQKVSQPLPVMDLSRADWQQVAEDSLLRTRHGIVIPTGAEFDAAERLAAKIEPTAKAKVRVYHLAAEYGIDSKFARTVLDNQFSANTKSPSSTVTGDVADAFREFMNTHTDA
jgi:hypothetical protein